MTTALGGQGHCNISGIYATANRGQLFYLEIFGINGINHYSFGNEPIDPGSYPENGTEEEQRKYNNSLREWDDYQSYMEMMDDLEESYVTEISQIFAVLTILIGIPTIAMFFGLKMKKCYNLDWLFGAISIIGEVWKAYISSEIVANFMESVPGEEIMLGLPKPPFLPLACVVFFTSFGYCFAQYVSQSKRVT